MEIWVIVYCKGVHFSVKSTFIVYLYTVYNKLSSQIAFLVILQL